MILLFPAFNEQAYDGDTDEDEAEAQAEAQPRGAVLPLPPQEIAGDHLDEETIVDDEPNDEEEF